MFRAFTAITRAAPAVSFTLTNEGSAKFGAFTGANINRQLAIVLDNRIYSAPSINSRIDGDGIIQGSFTQREAAAELNRSVFRVWAHVRFRVDEVIAVNEHAIAFLGAWHGPATDGGGEAEIAAEFVWTVNRDWMKHRSNTT